MQYNDKYPQQEEHLLCSVLITAGWQVRKIVPSDRERRRLTDDFLSKEVVSFSWMCLVCLLVWSAFLQLYEGQDLVFFFSLFSFCRSASPFSSRIQTLRNNHRLKCYVILMWMPIGCLMTTTQNAYFRCYFLFLLFFFPPQSICII